MKFDIRRMRSKGFKVLKNGIDERIVRVDGKPFNIWVGNRLTAHCKIQNIGEIQIINDKYREFSGVVYMMANGDYGSTIFKVTEIGLFADEDLYIG